MVKAALDSSSGAWGIGGQVGALADLARRVAWRSAARAVAAGEVRVGHWGGEA